jgi:TetR/AcrR family transcriptional regulator, repressor for uid operon
LTAETDCCKENDRSFCADARPAGRQSREVAVPKLKPATQRARRESILDAAETCFARSGFHRTTMQDLCKEASISPGALYLYFASKEALIAGICAREKDVFASRIQILAHAPDFLAALEKIAQHYFVETSISKRLVSVEMGVEATRNPQVAAICHDLEATVTTAFRGLFQRLADEGRIAPSLPIDDVTAVFQIMGDGLFWRRAVVPNFDAKRAIAGMMHALQDLLKPVAPVSQLAQTRGDRSRTTGQRTKKPTSDPPVPMLTMPLVKPQRKKSREARS